MSNQPRFEVFPEKKWRETSIEHVEPVLTGEFAWHFKDANGRITFTGGESFTRREDAHRSIHGMALDVLSFAPVTEDHKLLTLHSIRIVDLDENGDVLELDSDIRKSLSDPDAPPLPPPGPPDAPQPPHHRPVG